MSDTQPTVQRHLNAAQRPHRWTLSDPVWAQHVSFISIDDQEVTLGDDFRREGIFKRYRCALLDVTEGAFKSLIRKEFGADVWAEVLSEAQRRLPRPAPVAVAPVAASTPSPAIPAAPVVADIATPATTSAPPTPAPATTPTATPTATPAATSPPPAAAPSSAARQDVLLSPCPRVSVPLIASLIAAVDGFDPKNFARDVRAQRLAVVHRDLPAAAAATLCDTLRLAGLPVTTRAAA